MNRPSHRQALWAGLVILFVVNAVALGGAAWNRSQVESQLRLGERELRTPYAWQRDNEDSGVALTLAWRARPAQGEEISGYLSPYSYYGSQPTWLDNAKLAELGFSLTPPPVDAGNRDWRRRGHRVLLVLELDGEAYAQSLALAGERANAAKAKSAASPANKDFADAAKIAAEALATEQNDASRLFAVDAGLDRSRLRAKYPDRQRYVLVEALVQTYWSRDSSKNWRLEASIQRLMDMQIHLSRAQAQTLAPALESAGMRSYGSGPGLPIEVDVAFGRRLEPWIVAARVR